jgi:predicted RNA binding protein YcfA (HicA-like mRNA interferase family)
MLLWLQFHLKTSIHLKHRFSDRLLTGQQFAKALARLGYSVDRQTGSHMRLTTYENGEHHITVPNHSPIKVGTLNAILKGISAHFGLDRDELVTRLFSK